MSNCLLLPRFVASKFGRSIVCSPKQTMLWLCSVLLMVVLSAIFSPPVHAVEMSTRLISHHTANTAAARELPTSGPVATEMLGTMPPEISRILERGKLIVAVLGQDNAPFFMESEDGELGGLDIQLAQAIADQLGVELELNRSAVTFDAVVNTVFNRDADMAISKISRTMKRSIRVRFSRPYVQMRQGLLINRLQLAQQAKSSNVTAAIRALSGKVGVIKGSSYVGFLKQKFPEATIVERDSWADIVKAVSAGKILAGYRDELEIKKVVLTSPDAALQLQTAVLTDTQDALAMVLPWDSTHLLAFTNQYLDTLETEYSVDSILEQFSDYLMTHKPTA